MNGEWYTTPKCTVAETVSHRIVLISNFKSMATTGEIGRSAHTGQLVSLDYAPELEGTTRVEEVQVGPTKRRK